MVKDPTMGPGMAAVTKMATDTFSGNLSMAMEMPSPPRLWPTRTTLSSEGNTSMKLNNGSKYSVSDANDSGCVWLIPAAAMSSAVTLWPAVCKKVMTLYHDQAPRHAP